MSASCLRWCADVQLTGCLTALRQVAAAGEAARQALAKQASMQQDFAMLSKHLAESRALQLISDSKSMAMESELSAELSKVGRRAPCQGLCLCCAVSRIASDDVCCLHDARILVPTCATLCSQGLRVLFYSFLW